MNEAPTIYGKTIILRQPVEQDKHDWLACGRSKEIVRLYGGDTRTMKPFTLEDAEAFYQDMITRKYCWAVEYEGRCIASCRITVDERDRRARYATGIFDSTLWGKGIGTEMTQLVVRFAFETLKLHRVDLRVLSYNHRAIRCYEKCGFIIEGSEREGAYIEDKFETDHIMSILEQEYREREKESTS